MTDVWDDAAFQARVAWAQARKGLTRDELSQRAGCAKYYLYTPARKGRRIDIIIRLAQALDVSPQWLAFGGDLEADGYSIERAPALARVAEIEGQCQMEITTLRQAQDSAP